MPLAQIDRARLERLRHGAVVVVDQPAVFEVTGSGALTCLQGLLTNDLMTPGDNSLVYGALLTPKGMIVVDHWVIRRPSGFTMISAIGTRERSKELFTRSLPPRLAKAQDQTGSRSVAWLYGDTALNTLGKLGHSPMPEGPGRVTEWNGGALLVARPGPAAPFAVLVTGASAEVEKLAAELRRAGATRGDETDRMAARILAGWPEVDAEIDEKTLPQEARYDEIDGVSYTKGCYTGQETVARVHFRGHPNRMLRGLLWSGAAGVEPGTAVVVEAGSGPAKPVGTVESILRLPDRTLGLSVLRREIGAGGRVATNETVPQVVTLPFAEEHLKG
jgi:folate-binding protein YgfZ